MKHLRPFVFFVLLLSLPALACGSSTSVEPTAAIPPTVAPTNTPVPEPSPTEPASEAAQTGIVVSFEDTLPANASDGYGMLATGGSTVVVNVVPSETLDLRVEIQDENKSVITSVNENGLGGEEKLTYKFPSETQLSFFYIVVIAESGEGSYETDFVSSLGIAFDLLNHFQVYSNIGEKDYAMFTVLADAGSSLSAIAKPVEGESIDLVLRVFRVSDAQTILVEFNDAGPGETETVDYTFAEQGAYFLQVGDANNNGGRFLFGAEVK